MVSHQTIYISGIRPSYGPVPDRIVICHQIMWRFGTRCRALPNAPQRLRSRAEASDHPMVWHQTAPLSGNGACSRRHVCEQGRGHRGGLHLTLVTFLHCHISYFFCIDISLCHYMISIPCNHAVEIRAAARRVAHYIIYYCIIISFCNHAVEIRAAARRGWSWGPSGVASTPASVA